jgi:hypothetical protein
MGRAAALIPYALSLKHLFATGELDGLRGSVRVSNTGAVSGTVQAGVAESSLRWLPDATKTVFNEKKNGLYWCNIKIWGTEKNPENDFVAQITKQLDKHPLAWAGLALRGLSWLPGDALGTGGDG